MITLKIREEIETAIQSPKRYVKGHNLGKLRAAFDGMTSQICVAIVGEKPANRMMARRLLNGANQSQMTPENQKILEKLVVALRVCGTTLFRKDYADHADSLEGFIRKQLRDVIKELP